MQWVQSTDSADSREIIYWPENADFANFPKVRGGNPILFPFSARSFHQGEMGYWQDSSGVVRPMPMHGFSRDGSFKLTELNSAGFTAELVPTERDHAVYPFEYRFSVRYEFQADSFRVYFELHNLDSQPIGWSAGHHFYFMLPWNGATKRGDYGYRIPAAEAFRQSESGTLEPSNLVLADGHFDQPELPETIFTQLQASHAEISCAKSQQSIRIRILPDCEASSPWNAFVVWTESEKSPFYCVEPWMGPPNASEHGKGLHTVAAGCSARFGVEVAVT